MSANLPINWADKKDSPLLADFIAKHGAEYCMTAAEINQLRNAVNEMAVIQQSVFLGSAEPTFTPIGTGRAYWIALKPGTYPNHGGVVLGANEIAFIIRDAAGVFTISKSALDLSTAIGPQGPQGQQGPAGPTGPAGTANMVAWSAIGFASGSQVNHLGKDWVANAATVAGDVPGTSSKWVERLSGYNKEPLLNEISSKASSIQPNFKNGLIPSNAFVKYDGKIVNANGSISTNATYAYFEFINRGLEYRLSGVFSNTPNFKIISYYDSSNFFISNELISVGNSFVFTDYILTVPANTYYVRVNANSAGVVPTGKETDLRSASINYVNEINAYTQTLNGIVKDVKISEISEINTEYIEVLNTYSLFPSNTVMKAQNKVISFLKSEGLWNKIDVLQIYATSSIENALVNVKNPLGKKPLQVKTPIFEVNKGFRGVSATGACIDSNFTPSIDGLNVTLNSHSYFIGVNSNENSTASIYDLGGFDGTNYVAMRSGNGTGFAEFFTNFNTSTSYGNGNRRKRHIGYSKLNGATNANIDYLYAPIGHRAPTSLLSKPIFICGMNNNSNSVVSASERLVSYFIAAGGLNANEQLRLIEIMEDYLISIKSPIQDTIIVDSAMETKEIVLYETITPTAGVFGRETIHPSVKDLGKKVNGFRYWSVNTPYPLADGSYELPSIYVSDDLSNWYPPVHGINPLFPRLSGIHYYSDNDLIYDAELGKFFMYFRCTNFSSSASKICVIESSNGVNWNIDQAQTVNNYTVVLNEAVLTPSIKKVGAKYYMYALNTGNVLTRWECDTPNGTFINPVNTTGWDGTNINHFSYLYFNNKHYLIVAKTSAKFCVMLTSNDGITFTQSDNYLPPLRTSKPYENIGATPQYYRPDLVVLDGEVWVYYSMGVGGSGNYGNICARVKLRGI